MERGIRKLERRIAGIGEEWGERIKEVERRIEIKERQKRSKNLILKEVKVKEGKRKEAVEEMFKDIGVKVKIGETQKSGGNAETGMETIWMRLESEGQRREVIMLSET